MIKAGICKSLLGYFMLGSGLIIISISDGLAQCPGSGGGLSGPLVPLCSNQTGTLVFDRGLPSTQYQLYKDGTVIGSDFTGSQDHGGGTDYNQFTVGPGTYQVKGKLGPCSSFTSNTYTVTLKGKGNLSISGGNPNICAGASVTLTASGGNNYSWSTGATVNSITVSPSVTTTYTVTGIESVCGLSADPLPVTVNVSKAVGTVSTPTGPSSACQGNSTTYYASASDANHYQWNVDPPEAGTTSSSGPEGVINWSDTYTGTGVKVKVTAFSGSSCSTFSTATKTSITINANPLKRYNVLNSGVSWCTGGTGTNIWLDGDGGQPGVYYWIMLDDDLLYEVPKLATSTSKPKWNNLKITGKITIYATTSADGSGCYRYMNNTFTLSSNSSAFPALFDIGGGGSYCPSDKNGVNITLSGSESGVVYGLRINKSDNTYEIVDTMNGTGKPLVFKGRTVPSNTIFSIVADRPSISCSRPMRSTATISRKEELNALFKVTPTNFCSGPLGGSIQISGSQSNAKYQLYKEGVPYDTAQRGKGSSLIWRDLSPGGRYSILAISNSSNVCSITLKNDSTIIKRMQPSRFTMSGGGSLCNSPSTTISLSGSETGVEYYLLRNGSFVSGQMKTGTGSPLTWTGINSTGLYRIRASIPGMLCEEIMRSSAKVVSGPVVSIDVDKYPCTYHFGTSITELETCGVKSYAWSFSDGFTSTSPDLFHQFNAPGNYTVTVSVTSQCDGNSSCVSTASKVVTVGDYEFDENVLVPVQVTQRDSVLNISVSTFSDAWELPFEKEDTSTMNPFRTGERGIWRNNAQYVYKAERAQSPTINLAKDGTYKIDMFNWQQSAVDAVPNWIKANTVTKYSPYSYELENKDVMGIYSSAVYDYNGQLVTAQGNNMRHNEMAYTGFENNLAHDNSGNWTFHEDPNQTSVILKVAAGYGHMAIVEAPRDLIPDVDVVNVYALYFSPREFWLRGFNTNRIRNDSIICVDSYPLNDQYSVVILDEAPFPKAWIGALAFKNLRTGSVATTDTLKHHTGNSSLKITTTSSFPQPQLQLDSGKTYYISAWVATQNSAIATAPTIGNNIGIDIIVTDKNDDTNTTSFNAGGPIVDGWQQVKGEFKVTAANTKIDITFRTGLGTAWFDDLRIHPNNGMMKSYVYDLKDYRLTAILDEQNFASLFYYDSEGNLYLTKKETERGKKTITESVSHIKKIRQ